MDGFRHNVGFAPLFVPWSHDDGVAIWIKVIFVVGVPNLPNLAVGGHEVEK